MPIVEPDFTSEDPTTEFAPRPDWKAPFTPEELRLILIGKFSSNYAEKFGTKHVPEKNVFSVSALTSGPGSAVSQRKQTLKNTDAETGEEAKVFNMAMFRGSAIHKYAEEKLPDWHAYGSEQEKCPTCLHWAVSGKKLYLKETIPFVWQDGVTKDIVIIGHPDFVKDDILLELKTMSSNEEDPEKLQKYKKSVKLKAYRQAGYYGKALTREIRRHYFCYVVTVDENPARHPITDADKTAGFMMINDGETQLQLDEKMIKRGYVYDSALRVYLLTEDEAWHGYNYVRWSAKAAVEQIENEENQLVAAEEVEVPPLGVQA